MSEQLEETETLVVADHEGVVVSIHAEREPGESEEPAASEAPSYEANVIDFPPQGPRLDDHMAGVTIDAPPGQFAVYAPTEIEPVQAPTQSANVIKLHSSARVANEAELGASALRRVS